MQEIGYMIHFCIFLDSVGIEEFRQTLYSGSNVNIAVNLLASTKFLESGECCSYRLIQTDLTLLL